MSSTNDYLQLVLDNLSPLEGIDYRYMMGEYIIYFRDKIAGGIFDNRLLIKPVKSAVEFVKKPIYQLPYEKGSNMLFIENVENSDYLCRLFEAIYADLPKRPQKKQKKKI